MKQGLMRHVVLFKFTEETKEGVVKGLVEDFQQLEQKISEVISIESGMNESPEGLNKGMTHCFIVTFRTDSDRDMYLVHPEHLLFVDQLKPYLEDVCVVDFWAKS